MSQVRFIYLFLLLLFISPSLLFSAYPGECTYQYVDYDLKSEHGEQWYMYFVYDCFPTFNGTSWAFPCQATYRNTYGTMYVFNGSDWVIKYWEDGQWKYGPSMSTSYFFTSILPPPKTITPPANGCAGLPQHCDDEWNALVAQCGDDDRIKNWDVSTCTGGCDTCTLDCIDKTLNQGGCQD